MVAAAAAMFRPELGGGGYGITHDGGQVGYQLGSKGEGCGGSGGGMVYDLRECDGVPGTGGGEGAVPAWTVQGTGVYGAHDAGAAAVAGTDVGWQHQHSHQQPAHGASGGYHIELRM